MDKLLHWIYQWRELVSEKNGTIVCQRVLGRWQILVNGTGQTTSYTTHMWKKALRRIPKEAHIKRVLMLGLGAGGALEKIHRRFPGCSVTAVEYDPVMVELTRELHLFTPKHRPEIIVGDAREVVPALTKKFDLIIVDLFSGADPSPLVHDAVFLQALRATVHQNGYLIFNVFKKNDYLAAAGALFSYWETLKHQFNYLGIFRPFGNGRAGDPLPASYVEPRSYKPYLRSNFYHPKFPSFLIQKEGYLGTRWNHGPLWFEEFATDSEPVIDPFPHARMIMWQRITRRDIPKGWRRFWLNASIKKTGFAEITDPKHYFENWSDHAKRHRKRFLAHDQKEYVIEETDAQEYAAAYRKTKKSGSLKNLFIRNIERRIAIHGTNMKLFVVRKKENREIAAGLAVLDMPEINQSIHVAAFTGRAAENTSVGTGIIDHWFLHCIGRGIRVLNFGAFYTFGEPRAWKGFSRFKSQFGIYYVRCSGSLFRWVGKNK